MYSELFSRVVKAGDLVLAPTYGRYMGYLIVEDVVDSDNGIASDLSHWKKGDLHLARILFKTYELNGGITYKTRRLAKKDYSVYLLNNEEFYNMPTITAQEKEFVLELTTKIKNGKRI